MSTVTFSEWLLGAVVRRLLVDFNDSERRDYAVGVTISTPPAVGERVYLHDGKGDAAYGHVTRITYFPGSEVLVEARIDWDTWGAA